ncbi:amphoterin-induced protein 2 [Hemicordylus capensis]|uniref:amphoterin-induced protein 2 n=1 Tax=Hemicordylus capensis TaxID=884348 RepID=UPI002303C991|nr:amphoterin-induced protein 2 [Hemicordylus capensis]XP_053112377.1 amphoterin-induced protein 2 [Hemicordylus capensis]XP_053112378.1 amphoterin-induced protein 2 [Hemicordylus capensis]XP_053112379.1 amphoterin-induced protein 2 [Hemicordylus capensis]XP_053112380.1 amphoterin-induced protein 2 [Hemicordylus capensis]XP_053112382.1 amphoterin-induced protein 2 [Hemicordylus capensis]XP_053112383.1 amphoterin-induced protein 2 [Hemicordylus capensis]XP_053112384.1 amphoterin-induced prote
MSSVWHPIPAPDRVLKVNYKKLVCLLIFTVSVCYSVSGMCPTACICASDIVSCTSQNLSRVPSTLFKHIKRLDLSHNRIGILDHDWMPLLLDKLSTLIVSHNSITSISAGSFSVTPNIKYLDLSSNNLRSLGSPVFQELRVLEVLLLYNNHIAQIDSAAFGGIHKLQKLYLSYNSLSRFPIELYIGKHKLSELMLLDISYNHIQSIPINYISLVPARRLSGIYLHGNPFYCDCTLYSMLNFWYLRHFSSVEDFKTEYTCVLRSGPKGSSKLSLLQDNYLNCSEGTINGSFHAFGFIHEAPLGERLIVHCDTKISDVGTYFIWITPDNQFLEPDKTTEHFRVFHNGSLEIEEAQYEDAGLYSCTAINKKRLLNETIEVRINVSNFTVDRSPLHETFNTAFTTLAACVASIILVLLYLYLTPCPCRCKSRRRKRKLNQSSAHASILTSNSPLELPADEKKASTGKRVVFLEPVKEPKPGQNGKVRMFPNENIIAESILKAPRTKSDSDSMNSVFSDTPFMP